jgi:hypothetical protein
MWTIRAQSFFGVPLLCVLCAGPTSPASQQEQADKSGPFVRESFLERHAHILASMIDRDENLVVTAGQDPSILIWYAFTDPKKRQTLRVALDTPINTVAFAKMVDGAKVLVSGNDLGDIRAWDVQTGKEVGAWQSDHGLFRVAFLARENVLALTGRHERGGGIVRFLNLQNQNQTLKKTETKRLANMRGRLEAVSPQESFLALRMPNGSLQVLFFPSRETACQIGDERSRICSVDFAPNEKSIVLGAITNAQSAIGFWDVKTGKTIGQIPAHPLNASARPGDVRGGILVARCSPTGLLVASGGFDGTVHLWEFATKQRVHTIAKLSPFVRDVHFFNEDKFVITCGDGDVHLCDLATIKSSVQLPGKLQMPEKMEAHWETLQSGDGLRGVVAVEFFLGHAKPAVAFLKTKLVDEKPPDPAALGKLIDNLGSSVNATRETARLELERHVYLAEPILRQRLAKNPDAETRRRIEGLLEKVPKLDNLRPTDLRPLRVISILERIEIAESRKLLQWMAKNLDTDFLRAEAKRALPTLQQ